jgi:RNA polymerase sigma-70 factor (ECF subfamily)
MATGREPALPDAEIVRALKAGDEAVFADLVDAYSPGLMRMAMMFVRDRVVAEDVVQDTWIAVLRGIDRFEGRSSLKTWILRILANRAKTRGTREARCVPFSCLGPDDADEPAADLGHWSGPPRSWAGAPEERLLARETLEHLRRAIEALPSRHREVIVLRDVEGWDGVEVCAALGLSEGNQRVLLHRARSRVRAELDTYLSSTGP